MDNRILILLVIYVYITNSRISVDAFNYAHGLYADVWSAWAELIINVSVTIICGLQWGIIGILIGKLASLIPIVVIWKPYYLFTTGFKVLVRHYWQNIVRNYAISAFAILPRRQNELVERLCLPSPSPPLPPQDIRSSFPLLLQWFYLWTLDSHQVFRSLSDTNSCHPLLFQLLPILP